MAQSIDTSSRPAQAGPLTFWVRLPALGTAAAALLFAVGVLLVLLPGISTEVAKTYWVFSILIAIGLLLLSRRVWVVPAGLRRAVTAVRESRSLLRESRGLLKRAGKRLEPATATRVHEAVSTLEAALEQPVSPTDGATAVAPDLDKLVAALRKLDELADRYLSIHRKSTFVEYAESIGIAVLLAFFLRTFVVEAFKIPSGSMIPTLMVGDHIFVNKYLYGIRVPLTFTKVLDIREPHRGEVVVFIKPDDPENRDYIKRVMGVGGDTMVLRDSVLTRVIKADGTSLDVRLHELRRNVACDADPSDPTLFLDPSDECVLHAESVGGGPWHPVLYRRRIGTRSLLDDVAGAPEELLEVEPGHLFCMGDNRDNSSDSRYWGTVPLNHVKGRAIAIWWSFGDPAQRWERFGLPVD